MKYTDIDITENTSSPKNKPESTTDPGFLNYYYKVSLAKWCRILSMAFDLRS